MRVKSKAKFKVDRHTEFKDLPEWISVSDLANWLGVSPGSVYLRIKQGRLCASKLGGLRISKPAIKDYLELREGTMRHAH